MIEIILVVVAVVSLFVFSILFKTVKCHDGRIDGKNVVITGGNTGIGLETGIELAKRGASLIIIGCRDLKKGQKAVEQIKKSGSVKLKVHLISLDLGAFESVRKFAKSVQEIQSKIHILINNAGVMIGNSSATVEGHEMHMGTNHLGHFLLTHLLEKNLLLAAQDQGDARIINVSSEGHKFTMLNGLDVNHPRFGFADWAYTGWFRYYRLYGQSKLAQIYHARELTRRLQSKGIISVSLHPGAVNTEITRYHQSGFGQLPTMFINWMMSLFGKTAQQGALTTIHCCVAPSNLIKSGAYYVDCKEQDIFPWLNNNLRKEMLLWEKSCVMVGCK